MRSPRQAAALERHRATGATGTARTAGLARAPKTPGAKRPHRRDTRARTKRDRISYTANETSGISFVPVITIDEITITADCGSSLPGGEDQVQIEVSSSTVADLTGIVARNSSGTSVTPVEAFNTNEPVSVGQAVYSGTATGTVEADLLFNDPNRAIAVRLHADVGSPADPSGRRVYGTAIPTPG